MKFFLGEIEKSHQKILTLDAPFKTALCHFLAKSLINYLEILTLCVLSSGFDLHIFSS